MNREKLKYSNDGKIYPDHLVSLTIFEEYYYLTSIVWVVGEYGVFTDFIDMFVLELHQHGIISHFLNLEKANKISKLPPGPQVLTLFTLSAGFIVWISTVFVACITFVCEHVVRYLTVTRYLKKIIYATEEQVLQEKENEKEEDEEEEEIDSSISKDYDDSVISENKNIICVQAVIHDEKGDSNVLVFDEEKSLEIVQRRTSLKIDLDEILSFNDEEIDNVYF
jgi:hypothetical protein